MLLKYKYRCSMIFSLSDDAILFQREWYFYETRGGSIIIEKISGTI